ncbi:hypothetical protein ACIBP6_19160 [Nonomuraea terrae]|nr:hypothetical protein [Nonomuraea terrae]
MRMRFALSALIAALAVAVTVGANATAASAIASPVYNTMDDMYCC